MQVFAELLNRLAYTPGRNAKIGLMVQYFRSVPDPDRGWALAALTDGLPFSFPVRKTVQMLMAERVDDVLFRLSRDYVGDTAETVALLWREPGCQASTEPIPSLGEVVERLTIVRREDFADLLAAWLDCLDATERWALLKLLTGALRVGVSARLAKVAVAQAWQKDITEIEEVWHALRAPYRELFAWLDGFADRPDTSGAAVFRPLMLANPLEDRDFEALDLSTFAVEWKWDGIRVQVASKAGDVRIYSRTGDNISQSFPELVEAFVFDAVLDGELLVVRDGAVAPFSDLQQRLNRKVVSKRLIRDFPGHVRFYDALEIAGEDLRALPQYERRERLERWFEIAVRGQSDLSPQLMFPDKAALQEAWENARDRAIEGLMLKRRDSPYLAGRPKGHWYKWKRAPLTVDCVMMYAQRGAGKRSSFYSDYTFGAWHDTDAGLRELVPVGKAYSGFTDEELMQLDRWVRNNSTERYGPLRAVQPALVLEVAFDSVHRSKRHKSGVAMRFSAHQSDSLG